MKISKNEVLNDLTRFYIKIIIRFKEVGFIFEQFNFLISENYHQEVSSLWDKYVF